MRRDDRRRKVETRLIEPGVSLNHGGEIGCRQFTKKYSVPLRLICARSASAVVCTARCCFAPGRSGAIMLFGPIRRDRWISDRRRVGRNRPRLSLSSRFARFLDDRFRSSRAGSRRTPSVSPTDQIARLDRDVADQQRIVDPAARREIFAGAPGCTGRARKSGSRLFRGSAPSRTQPSMIRTAELRGLRRGRHDLAPIAVFEHAVHVGHDHVARLRDRDRTMQPEIIARR